MYSTTQALPEGSSVFPNWADELAEVIGAVLGGVQRSGTLRGVHGHKGPRQKSQKSKVAVGKPGIFPGTTCICELHF